MYIVGLKNEQGKMYVEMELFMPWQIGQTISYKQQNYEVLSCIEMVDIAPKGWEQV